MEDGNDLRVHNKIGLVGLRAQATAVGLIQLCVELKAAGCLSEDAILRIKDVVARDIALAKPHSMSREEFDAWVHSRLDELFSSRPEPATAPPSA